MQIEEVDFVDFRSYQRLLFTPTPSLNILTGANAQGKTNLLEGLAVFAVGRSFRGAKVAEMARWGAPRAMVTGAISRNDSPRVLRRVLAPREDGVWAMAGDSCTWARMIPFGWSDVAIIDGPPQARRNFLDGFVAKLYPSYGSTYRRYRHILARRNHLLQTAETARVPTRLDPWNAQLIDTGLEVMTRRRQALAALAREVGVLFPLLGGWGEITVEYVSSLGAEPTAERFTAKLEARYRDEIRRGQTLVGPHRDDVAIGLDGRDLRMFGSRGQQRLMALTLRLAEAGPVAQAVGSSPVLLLDDALSELDPAVQGRVLTHIAQQGQVFLTTAESALPDVGDARWWEVQGGRVSDARVAVLGGAA